MQKSLLELGSWLLPRRKLEKLVKILNWCLSHTEIFSKRRKICSLMSERLELMTVEKKYFHRRSDCWKIPLNWNWGRMRENSCLKKFLHTKRLPSCHKSLQPSLKCCVGNCDHLKTISSRQFVVNRSATPPIIDSDYDRLQQAVGWRHLHTWNKLEV